jgi:hypothetical protein
MAAKACWHTALGAAVKVRAALVCSTWQVVARDKDLVVEAAMATSSDDNTRGSELGLLYKRMMGARFDAKELATRGWDLETRH